MFGHNRRQSRVGGRIVVFGTSARVVSTRTTKRFRPVDGAQRLLRRECTTVITFFIFFFPQYIIMLRAPYCRLLSHDPRREGRQRFLL